MCDNRKKTGKKIERIILVLLASVLLLPSCASRVGKAPFAVQKLPKRSLAIMGYVIQAGAFARVENAARLTEKLKDQGLDATYFKASDGLFKVRFGNFPSRQKAQLRAQSLRKAGVIEVFYIVRPEEYSVPSKAAMERRI